MTWLASGATCEGHMRSTCWKLKSRWVKCNSQNAHYIYPHYLQNCKEAIQKKTLERFLQHTYLLKRELLILKWEILVVSSPSLFHCYTLRGDLYLNTTHTYSECRVFWSLGGIWDLLKEAGETWWMQLGGIVGSG